MSAAETARRHKQPRYVPLARGRGTPFPDPARVERTHPNWCDCPRCAPAGPADRGGCRLATIALKLAFAVAALAIGAGLAATFPVRGDHGAAIIFGARQ